MDRDASRSVAEGTENGGVGHGEGTEWRQGQKCGLKWAFTSPLAGVRMLPMGPVGMSSNRSYIFPKQEDLQICLITC
jgi:hypothetical protein